MEITRKFWLVGVVSVFMVANFASATVINLDMSTAPTTHGFYTNGTGTEDITTNPGQLTITTPGGTFNYNQNIIIDKSLQLRLKSDNFIAPELLLKTTYEADQGHGNDDDDEGEKYHRNVSNFSLGKIILVMLFGKAAENLFDFEKIKLIMNPIINTKIYFYVLRCIDPHPAMRANLYL